MCQKFLAKVDTVLLYLAIVAKSIIFVPGIAIANVVLKSLS